MDGASGSPAGDSPARARVRIGDQERERVVALLREHYAAGRLTLDEVRRRTEAALTASYADEADKALAELPAIAPPSGTPGAPAAAPPRRSLLGRRGHAQTTAAAPGWVRTAERFRDPSSGQIMRVWTDPADGSRHYVPDEPAS
jgi:Domain of unknown function (DUF1707)